MEAIREALKAKAKGEVPIGCVIVKNNKIISRAHNLKESMRMASAHAEMLAIDKACVNLNGWRLTGCDLYVTIEPCAMCAGLIYQSRIKRLIFGAYDVRGGACGGLFNILSNKALNHQVYVSSNVLEAYCNNVLVSFFNERRAK